MAIDAKLNLVLHKNQRLIHASNKRFKVVKAGKRFGKSQWAIFEICQKAGEKINGVFWYIAPTFGQAFDIAWNTLLNVLPPELVANKWESGVRKLTVQLTNGSYIVLKGADNKDTLRGTALDGVVFDECAYIDDDIWPTIVRGQLAKSQGFAYFISSPKNTGRNWYSNFCEDAQRRKNLGEDWDYWHFNIYDNPLLPKVEIEDIKAQCSDDRWQLEYMAEESALAGQLYSEFNFETHVKELKVQSDWKLVRGLDWGIAHPTVCLWVYIDEKNKHVYVEDEFVRSGFIIKDSCETIKSKTGQRAVDWSVIDPSTCKRNSQTGRRDMDEFARYGVVCVEGDNRDRGRDITKMFFKYNTITINPRCKNLIYELKNLQYGDKVGDDCTDSLRYTLVRIHDFIFHELTFDGKESNDQKFKENEYSFFDKRLFPNGVFEDRSSQNISEYLLEELA